MRRPALSRLRALTSKSGADFWTLPLGLALAGVPLSLRPTAADVGVSKAVIVEMCRCGRPVVFIGRVAT